MDQSQVFFNPGAAPTQPTVSGHVGVYMKNMWRQNKIFGGETRAVSSAVPTLKSRGVGCGSQLPIVRMV